MSNTPIKDRIDEIMNTSQTEAVMEMTPTGVFDYCIKEYQWKAAALRDMRSALEGWIATIDQKIDHCTNTVTDFTEARAKGDG